MKNKEQQDYTYLNGVEIKHKRKKQRTGLDAETWLKIAIIFLIIFGGIGITFLTVYSAASSSASIEKDSNDWSLVKTVSLYSVDENSSTFILKKKSKTNSYYHSSSSSSDGISIGSNGSVYYTIGSGGNSGGGYSTCTVNYYVAVENIEGKAKVETEYPESSTTVYVSEKGEDGAYVEYWENKLGEYQYLIYLPEGSTIKSTD